MVTLVPDRDQRAPSITAIIFSSSCPAETQNTTMKQRKPPIIEKPGPIRTYVDSKSTITGFRLASASSWFYELIVHLVPSLPTKRQKLPQIAEKLTSIRIYADSKSNTASLRSSLTSSVDYTNYSFI